MGLTFNVRALCSLPGLLKVFQIAIGITAILLLRNYQVKFAQAGLISKVSDYDDRQLTGVVAIGASLLISIPLLVGYVFFETASSLLESLFCITAAVMNITGGALAIEVYKDMSDSEYTKAGLAVGALMIINALVYLIDSITGTIRVNK